MFTDVLGELRAWDVTALTVDTDRGEIEIPHADIHRIKRVPPRATATPHQVATLERTAARGWLPPDHEYLGDWLLRAAGGWTSRANSALPIGDPGLPIGPAIDKITHWYRQRDREPLISLPSAGAEAVRAELHRRRWIETDTALVQVAGLTRVADPAPAVRLDDHLDDAFLAAIGRWKRRPPAAARAILTSGGAVSFATVVGPTGELIGTGRGVVTDGWLGLSLIWVEPSQRRTGLGRSIVGALARWASQHGATRAYLQVADDNPAAINLYTSLGFKTHHHYTGFRPGSGGPAGGRRSA
jgi:GNAT superfamily N-acetyltransferase